MRVLIRLLRALLPLIVIGVAGLVAVTMVRNRPEVETQAPTVEPPGVRAHLVTFETVRISVGSQGTVRPRTETQLVPQIAGRITSVSPSFVEGGFFEEGDVLLRLDRFDYEQAIVSARSQLAQARLQLAQEEAEAEVAQREWDALGRGDPRELTLRVPQLEDARASVAAAEANVERAERDLERADVVAPYSGRVRTKSVDVGQFVTVGSPIATVYAIDVAEVGLALPDGEQDVDVMLMGTNIETLQAAADEIKSELRGYAGVHGITDSFLAGKEEMKLGIRPAAETLGLSLQDLGRQVRQAFYGEEAQRIQRGRDDIRVMVRYPAEQRRSLGNLEEMRIRTPSGGEVPFSQVAVVEPGRGFASIKRVDRNRAVNVQAAIDASVTSPGDVNADLEARILPTVLARYPGVHWSFEGMQAEQAEGIAGLQVGFTIALLGIFALLAIPLKSYVQPLIIMSAIPFGLVGAIWGHLLMGVTLSMMSMFGLVALSGVVVNDSLIMVSYINRRRREHVDLQTAIREAGVSRFRPILLTSLTTFFGLAPLMLERSFDAEFLLPMAVSLAFGVIFATFITLILVPTEYLILDDIGRGMRRLFGRDSEDRNSEDVVPPIGGTPAFDGLRREDTAGQAAQQ